MLGTRRLLVARNLKGLSKSYRRSWQVRWEGECWKQQVLFSLGPQGVILVLPRLEVFSGASHCLPDVGNKNCGGNMLQWQGVDRPLLTADHFLGLVFAEVQGRHRRAG